MTFTNETNQAMQVYIDRLQFGPVNDKLIQTAINHKFSVSAASIRNKLIADGVIELKPAGYDPKRLRNIYMVSLVDASKMKFVSEQPKKAIQSVVIDTHWPEGWPKSKNNAFDWKNTAKGLFSKAELSAMQTKIKSNPAFTGDSIHTYSRAKPSV
jgi:hypothetical protein